ncbi:sensor domain-containing diguanylate cyclase [Alicyclobacillus sp. SO9]|uniref:sensor domain-containing diguanylate cyclase n=1 Tax=Alicyclobacillus sp. SO9 TaxID=2665646 RepID=UPI0018E711A1|nr:sensor domain-containing diguanylate cyclase [Alicyclobacillus sp. SO9]QQE77456.1 GGDEF domain-containing protein [Alicyclobacillus sp. SO9]
MRTRRQTLLLAYEWLAAFCGALIGGVYVHSLLHMNEGVFLYLLVLGVVLESLPVPVGKVFTSLILILPVVTLIIMGTGQAIWLIILSEFIAMLLQPSQRKWSVKFFNVGQYAVSVLGMSIVYHWIVRSLEKPPVISWNLLFGLAAAIAAFMVVNHALIHIHSVIRELFSIEDLYNTFLAEAINYALSLPLILVMISLTPSQPLLGMLSILPILGLGQLLRLYRRITFAQIVQRSIGRLMSEFDIEHLSAEVAQTAVKLSYADVVSIHLLQDDGESTRVRAVYPVTKWAEMSTDALHRSQGGLIWSVLDTDATFEYVPDTGRDARVRWDGVPSVKYRSMAVFPIRVHGKLHGAVVCYAARPHAFAALTDYLAALAAQFAVLLENAKLYQLLQEQSRRDAATGLYNYRYFYEQLAKRLSQAKELDKPCSVAVIDIDNFKQVNDTYGHLAGDAVLQSLSKLFLKHVDDETLVARYGGEEFVMVFGKNIEDTRDTVELIRQTVASNTIMFNSYQLQGITVSAGIAAYPDNSANDRDLLLKADSALYWGAKQRGRNKTAVYSPDFDAELFIDKLTGLYTLHYATIELRDRSYDFGGNWAAICIDVEHLGKINTTFGFASGNSVLKEVSRVIKENIRQSELACRYGADDFLILLPDVTEQELGSVTRRLHKALAKQRFVYKENITLAIHCHMQEFVMPKSENAADFLNHVQHTFTRLHQRSSQAGQM